MAVTCTVSMAPDPVVTEMPTYATLPIVNGASSAVTVTNISLEVVGTSNSNYEKNAGVSIGAINYGPNANLTVPGSGTLYVVVPMTFHAPSTGVLSSGSGTYTVGGCIYTSDGGAVSISTDTVTVNYAVSYSPDED